MGIASFKEFRWEEDMSLNTGPTVHGFLFSYCKPTSDVVCPGVDAYPSVGEGEISPSTCGYGYHGYSYRVCTNGVLGEVMMDRCIHKLPANLVYEESYFTLVIDTQVSIAAPSYDNIIEQFYLDVNEVLPEGLVLDSKTGAITGVPKEELLRREFDIFGSNGSGVTRTSISLSVRKGECKPEGQFHKVQVGETAIFECSSKGAYVGTESRKCLLGSKDGEWQKTQGVCISIVTITVIIVVAILLILVVIFIIVRSRKTKAVGGVKGKKIVPKKAPGKKEVGKKEVPKVVKV